MSWVLVAIGLALVDCYLVMAIIEKVLGIRELLGREKWQR